MIRGQMPVGPSRQHIQYSDRSASFVPRESRNASFFSPSRQQRSQQQTQRIPFDQQRQAFTGARTAGQGSASPRGSFENTRPPSAGDRTPQSRGWRSFGEPAPSQGGGSRSFENTRPSQAAPQNRGSSWQRFGEPGGSPRQSRGVEGGAPSGSGSVVRERPTNRTYEAPSAPSYSAPRGRESAPGGFGQPRRSYEAPSSGGGGSAPRRSYQAPSAPSSGGGGSFSPRGGSPRSSGGGSFSAPRSSGGGGGGGVRMSAPRSSGGGSAPRGGGGGGGRPSGGGGGSGRSRGR